MPEEAFQDNSLSNYAQVQESRQGQHSLGKEDLPAQIDRSFINSLKLAKPKGLFQT